MSADDKRLADLPRIISGTTDRGLDDIRFELVSIVRELIAARAEIKRLKRAADR